MSDAFVERFEQVLKHRPHWSIPLQILRKIRGWEGRAGLHLSWGLGLKTRHGIISISRSFHSRMV